MHHFVPSRLAAVIASAATAMVITAGVALAAPGDYRFEAVQSDVKASSDAVVAVRLIHTPDSKPVKGAIIFSSKMEMPMSGMAPMATKVAPLRPSNPGEYPFQSDLSMAGPWTLTLAAKVQGETATITGSVPFMAMK